MRMSSAVLIALVVARPVMASDPAQALSQARDAIAGKEYQRASDILHATIPDAMTIEDAKKRSDALSAIHFYRALAESQMNDDAVARTDLREFFRLHPGKSAVDPTKYPPSFVEMFRVENIRASSMGADATAFDQQYPGFDAVSTSPLRNPNIELWGITPDFQLLATDRERDAWAVLRDNDSRARFVNEFWSRRDPKPDTPANEWREEFTRRVLFADTVFGQGSDVARGSLTDRGKVFIILGRPARVYREPIRYNFGNYQGLNGTAERWVYFREQLPAKMPAAEVDFRFIDQPGYGDHALLRDVISLQALDSARVSLAR